MADLNGQQMRDLAEVVAKKIPGTGYVILTFPLDQDEGRLNYISNGNREDVIIALANVVKSFTEGGEFPTPEKP